MEIDGVRGQKGKLVSLTNQTVTYYVKNLLGEPNTRLAHYHGSANYEVSANHTCNFISLWECLSSPNFQLSTHNALKEVGQI